MMREVKLRAWDKEEKRWLYFTLIDLVYSSDGGIVNIKDWDDTVWVDKLEWYQYTGLKDKNRKEIWEGDVVKGIRGVLGECKFKKGRFLIEYEDDMELTFIHENKRGVKVLGNIYENPELLKREDEHE